MFGSYAYAACGCGAGANLWIEAWFGDCIYSHWELTSFCFGLSSVLFWLVAQVPQFISNWRLQSAEALSPWFLFQWLAGDTFNFLGCLLTGNQLATQTLSASYFMFADFIIISQYSYYQKPSFPEKEPRHSTEKDPGMTEGKLDVVYRLVSPPSGLSGRGCSRDIENGGEKLKVCQRHLDKYQSGKDTRLLTNYTCDVTNPKSKYSNRPDLTASTSPSLNRELRRVIMQYGLEYGHPAGPLLRIYHGPLRKHRKYVGIAAIASVVCLGATALSLGSGNQSAVSVVGSSIGRKLLIICNDPRALWIKDSGTVIGWASASLYLGSRISQVVKNLDRGSAEGLSLAMVSCAILANLTYGISIVMRLNSWLGFFAKAPWLVGSLGTVSLDFFLLLQAHYLVYQSQSRKDKLSEYTPLLIK
ncbi:uncharacterized protein [Physcomitrium patens]|uniref:PQ-loop repeat family protein / transmembrane family protein n=3 Tax=Physcomitrium patens TaxID=3218 RepID=A0A2K1IIL8_PHYPA|nr:uncharacterized protein LOC112275652 [Physcomitrium patens]PNR29121.1 hypothetical protein PHYPA_027813 [Physcomitrium patens]|eukprot:XP_024361964.1 uncharacterized protein LOC112275652 [Physcomitrella patens]